MVGGFTDPLGKRKGLGALLVGYFEGITSQRGIAWRCSDSRSLAEFLGIPADKTTPDHSTMS